MRSSKDAPPTICWLKRSTRFPRRGCETDLMRVRLIPGRKALAALAAAAAGVLAALLAGLATSVATSAALTAVLTLLAASACDYALSRRAWRRCPPRLTRRLPAAFAIGIKRSVQLTIVLEGSTTWACQLHDHSDPSLLSEGLPVALTLQAGTRVETAYSVVPTRRGEVIFSPAEVRIRSRWGLCELIEWMGVTETRRVYPDFAQVARYAWLAGDRRLREIGIKTYQLRGQGTDF